MALYTIQAPVFGIVYKPFSKECFWGTSEGKTFYNGHPILSRTKIALKDSLVGTGFPYRSPDLFQPFFESAKSILKRSRGIRRIGSGALELSYVAAGFLQAYWEADLKPYDVASALIFLANTNCVVTNFSGKPYDFERHRGLLAAPPGAHAALLKILKKCYPFEN